MGKGSDVVTGYWYKMGLHMVICHGPVDAILEIRAGDRSAWSGNITTSTTITINQQSLFGGEKKEGGIVGDVGFAMGDSAQQPDAYLKKFLAAPVPAFRGVLAAIVKGATIAANNPYIKPWAFKVKRINTGWNNSTVWNAAYAEIGANGDMNPAHILYQCITDPEWGMGYPTSMIDDISFTAAATVLYSEGFGLSLLWNRSAQVGEFIQMIINHIGASFYADPKTGRFALKLIRADYNINTLPAFDTSNVAQLIEFQRATWADTVNEVTVTFSDRNTGKTSALSVQNLAAISSQGAVVNAQKNYPGITDATLASRVAMRDLASLSTPLAKVKLKINRAAWSLVPGDVFTFSWLPLGITSIVFRVVQINSGTLTDGAITVDAVEDIFGLPTNSYSAQQATSWVDPSNIPQPCPVKTLREATYWDIVRTVAPADRAYYTDSTCFLLTIGERPSSDATDYDIQTTPTGSNFVDVARGHFTPTATIVSPMVRENSTSAISYDAAVDLDLVKVGTYAMVDSELMAVTAIDTTAMTVSFDRGVLDTVPASHAAGARLWFYDSVFKGKDPTEYTTNETVSAKLLPLTGKGQLAAANDTPVSLTMVGRWSKPYPPGNFQINGAYFPLVLAGVSFTASWAHRDRTQQTANLTPQTTGNIGPETGTTYTVTFKDQAGTQLQSHAGLTGTSDVYTPAANSFFNKVRVTIIAVRSGYTSYQSQDHTFDRAGYGLNYGLYYGMGN